MEELLNMLMANANVSEEEKAAAARVDEAMKALDDAMDAMMVIHLKKEFGVEAVCNPDGDRSKIKIDGVIMDKEEFAVWYIARKFEQLANSLDEVIDKNETSKEEKNVDKDRKCEKCDKSEVAPREDLPSTIEIDYCDLYDAYDEAEIYDFIRDLEGRYLSGKHPYPDIDWDDDNEVITVSNIHWGRKR